MTTTNKRSAQDLVILKGMCVRYGQYFGIIDELFPFGYGFATSDKSGWYAFIVQKDDIQVLDNVKDVKRAVKAALNYYAQEGESLCRRQRMRYPQDQKPFWRDRIQHQISTCMYWYYRLQNLL